MSLKHKNCVYFWDRFRKVYEKIVKNGLFVIVICKEKGRKVRVTGKEPCENIFISDLRSFVTTFDSELKRASQRLSFVRHRTPYRVQIVDSPVNKIRIIQCIHDVITSFTRLTLVLNIIYQGGLRASVCVCVYVCVRMLQYYQVTRCGSKD